MDQSTLVLAVLPLLLLSLGLTVWALVDLSRNPFPRHLPRWAWAVIVVAVTFGSIVYLVIGREHGRAR